MPMDHLREIGLEAISYELRHLELINEKKPTLNQESWFKCLDRCCQQNVTDI